MNKMILNLSRPQVEYSLRAYEMLKDSMIKETPEYQDMVNLIDFLLKRKEYMIKKKYFASSKYNNFNPKF